MNTSPLSEREYELAGYKAYGYTAEETASKLFISAETVKNHWKNAAVKLGIKASKMGAWFFCFTYNISMDFTPMKRGLIASAFLLLVMIELFNPNESSMRGRKLKSGSKTQLTAQRARRGRRTETEVEFDFFTEA